MAKYFKFDDLNAIFKQIAKVNSNDLRECRLNVGVVMLYQKLRIVSYRLEKLHSIQIFCIISILQLSCGKVDQRIFPYIQLNVFNVNRGLID